ncbi:MAG: hypothetical protein EOP06_07630 [Proteobacteria bacterium]|nr:MAG: hypothetical protein EOP06_07630 [Pseudomonadota bacterium]
MAANFFEQGYVTIDATPHPNLVNKRKPLGILWNRSEISDDMDAKVLKTNIENYIKGARKIVRANRPGAIVEAEEELDDDDLEDDDDDMPPPPPRRGAAPSQVARSDVRAKPASPRQPVAEPSPKEIASDLLNESWGARAEKSLPAPVPAPVAQLAPAVQELRRLPLAPVHADNQSPKASENIPLTLPIAPIAERQADRPKAVMSVDLNLEPLSKAQPLRKPKLEKSAALSLLAAFVEDADELKSKRDDTINDRNGRVPQATPPKDKT